jgi:DNA polymerase I
MTKQEALIAAYLLDPGKREYKIGGSSSWAKLAKRVKAKKLDKIFHEIEIPLIKVLAKMEARGVKLDKAELAKLSNQSEKRIIELTKKIYRLAGSEFNIASPNQLREVLFDKLQIPADNLRKTGKTKALSTAATELEKLRELHPIIDLISEYRELAKLKSTYLDALPKLVGDDGRVHTKYSQTIAATGRLSSSDPNLQNIPIRTELGNSVRKAFVAEKGFVLASLDYSQIELRIAATLSGDREMIKIFESGGDFHTATAARIFGVPEARVTRHQRRDAKTINFSVLYGVSAFGLSSRSEMSQVEAADYIDKYYIVFKDLKKYIDQTIEQAHKDEFVVNPLGRIRYFQEINSTVYPVRSAAERAAFNMPIQSLAADMMKMAIIEVDRFLGNNSNCHMLLSVHDELIFEIKKDQVKNLVPKLKQIMEFVYKLKVPVVVDAKIGPNWMEMKTLDI